MIVSGPGSPYVGFQVDNLAFPEIRKILCRKSDNVFFSTLLYISLENIFLYPSYEL
jgi:hypothetical protein